MVKMVCPRVTIQKAMKIKGGSGSEMILISCFSILWGYDLLAIPRIVSGLVHPSFFSGLMAPHENPITKSPGWFVGPT